MSKKANPTVIGAFVLAALAIAAAGILILGSGKLFSETEHFVLYFDGNLAGLDVGAPVEYGGVRIGTVTDIRRKYNTDDDTVLIPVFIEIEQDRFEFTGAATRGSGIAHHIQQGLKAQLQSQSFVTGKLKIMLMLDPDSPAHLRGGDPSETEIPTVPTLLESLGESLSELPIADIITNLNATVKTIADIADSGNIEAIFQNLRKVSESLARISDSNEIEETAQALQGALGESEQFVKALRENIKPIQQDLSSALEEFAAAAKSARNLTDYIERHPEALLRGKGEE